MAGLSAQMEEAQLGIVDAVEGSEERLIEEIRGGFRALRTSDNNESSKYVKVNKAGRPIDDEDEDEDDGPLPTNSILGSGTFAVTYRTKCQLDGQLRAMKVVKAQKAKKNGVPKTPPGLSPNSRNSVNAAILHCTPPESAKEA